MRVCTCWGNYLKLQHTVSYVLLSLNLSSLHSFVKLEEQSVSSHLKLLCQLQDPPVVCIKNSSGYYLLVTDLYLNVTSLLHTVPINKSVLPAIEVIIHCW